MSDLPGANQSVQVRDLERAERGRASTVLTRAFLDDPAWLAIGPDRARHRRAVIGGFHLASLLKADRFGGDTFAAARNGTVDGIAVVYPGDRFPVPEPWSTLLDTPSAVLAGPSAARRAMQVDALMRDAHPHEPHVYLWLLGVEPRVQRTGIGRALMNRVIADAEDRTLPVYLETARPENVAYYRSFGFEVTGDLRLPREGRMWLMWRDAGMAR